MLLLGSVSSLFDFTTFAVLWFTFGYRDPAHAPLFRTAWFTESLLAQTLVIHVIRTDRIPCLQSRASPGLVATTAAGPRKCPAGIPPGRAGRHRRGGPASAPPAIPSTGPPFAAAPPVRRRS